jgi:hypothetical protein
MQNEQVNPMSKDYLESCLSRLRKRLTYEKDSLDITTFAIKAIENDLTKMEEEDGAANEKNA